MTPRTERIAFFAIYTLAVVVLLLDVFVWMPN
jgi:hypothetical protein